MNAVVQERWRKTLTLTRDRLLRDGARIEARDVHLAAIEAAPASYRAAVEDLAETFSVRMSSNLLRKVQAGEEADEAAALFDAAEYRPPRAITLPQPDGRVLHVGVEHCTRDEFTAYIETVLTRNIDSAQEKLKDAVAFLRAIDPFWREGEPLIVVLRCLRDVA